jgi:hypothetical protein
VSSSGTTPTYRYVSDGSAPGVLDRLAATRLRHPAVLGVLVIFWLGFGVLASLSVNAASLPDHLGRVLLIGLGWGLAFLLLTVGLILCLVLILRRVFTARVIAPRFPAGSLTEVALGAETLAVRRPNGTREIPYRRIVAVRQHGSFLMLHARGQVVAEVLPAEMLPDDAVVFIRARARGAFPAATVPEAGEPTRTFVVPDGWPARVAAAHTRAALGRPATLARIGLAVLAVALLAWWAGPWWLLAVPIMVLTLTTASYLQARRMAESVLPPGSVASSEVYEDRLVVRNAGGVREIRFDDVRSVDVRGDVLLLSLASRRGTLLLARALVPDDALVLLRAHEDA